MSNQNIIKLREQQQSRIELQELRRDELIGTIGVWGPVAIPLIPAALTAVAIATHYPQLLHIHEWFATALGVIAAAGIEVLGIVSTETFLQMRSYNQMRSEGDEQAPAGAAGIVAGAYLTIVIALVVLLKVWPSLAIYSLLPLTALGALVSWIVVLRRQHTRRELEQLQRKEGDNQLSLLQLQNEALRKEIADLQKLLQVARTQPHLETGTGNIQETATCNTAEPEVARPDIAELNAARSDQVAERQAAILQLFTAYGEMAIAELQKRLQDDIGIEASDRTLRGDLAALVDAGDLVKSGRGRWDIAYPITTTLPTIEPVLNGHAH